jgi:hypothetical protein
MEAFKDIFGMPMMPHLYAIPMTIILGMAIGYFVRGKMESAGSEKLPPRPKVD